MYSSLTVLNCGGVVIRHHTSPALACSGWSPPLYAISPAAPARANTINATLYRIEQHTFVNFIFYTLHFKKSWRPGPNPTQARHFTTKLVHPCTIDACSTLNAEDMRKCG